MKIGHCCRPLYNKTLAPIFDHGSSLGRNESDEKRIARMCSKDQGYNVSGHPRYE